MQYYNHNILAINMAISKLGDPVEKWHMSLNKFSGNCKEKSIFYRYVIYNRNFFRVYKLDELS